VSSTARPVFRGDVFSRRRPGRAFFSKDKSNHETDYRHRQTGKARSVQDALNEREVYLMTVSNVHGCGRQRGYTETFRGGQDPRATAPKIKLEIAVNEDFVQPTIERDHVQAPAPSRARSATARSSCCRWRSVTAFAPASGATPQSGP
jgi:hypothetical protein